MSYTPYVPETGHVTVILSDPWLKRRLTDLLRAKNAKKLGAILTKTTISRDCIADGDATRARKHLRILLAGPWPELAVAFGARGR